MRMEEAFLKPIGYERRISEGKNLWGILFVGVVCVVCIGVFQDFIHSRINNYSFYIEESLLYKTVWILFLPLLYLQFSILQTEKINLVVRFALAISLPIAAHLFLTPLTVWFISDAFYSHTYSFSKILKYTLAEDFYKLLIVYGLSVSLHSYFVRRRKLKTEEFNDEKEENLLENTSSEEIVSLSPLEKLVVANGRNYVSIATDDIIYLAAATPYIAVQTASKRYLHSETLKSIGEKLDKNRFVRVHKSGIVNLAKVVSYKSRLNGDYDLSLENGEKIRLSRNYAENFKKLYNSTPQVKP